MRRLLILSFSNIAQDARVLKQVREFSADWEVTTCSYGERPEGATHHFRVPDDAKQWAYDRKGLILRRYERSYWANAAVSAARQSLSGHSWEAVIANDIDAVPLALALDSQFGVHADLHEFAPREKEDLLRWKLFVGPFRTWLCRTFLPRCASITTVGAGLAREYERQFGIEVGVVMNATPYAEHEVTQAGAPIRLVHSGAGRVGRRLEIMLEAVMQTTTDVTFDLFLTLNDPEYIADLKSRFGSHPRISINDPVPYEDLVRTLSSFDVGVFVLPPATFSYRWALPNKLFDFVQARLGVIVSPSPEMARIVEEYRLGAVTDGFEPADLVKVLDQLTSADVMSWKHSSDSAAHALSAEPQNARWRDAVERLATH